MGDQKHTILLSKYEYDILSENSMISAICDQQLESAKLVQVDQEDVYELTMTVAELDELVGFVAAEANHATNSRIEDALHEICDSLENRLYEVHRAELG